MQGKKVSYTGSYRCAKVREGEGKCQMGKILRKVSRRVLGKKVSYIGNHR